MEQVHNSVLDLMQMVTACQTGPSAACKSESAESSDFRKLMEQSQNAREQQAEDKAPEADSPDAPDTPDAPADEKAPVEESPEVQEQLALAALAVLQNPVVPIQQTLAPVVQEAAAPAAAVQTQMGDSPVTGLEAQQTVEAPATADGSEQLLPEQPQTAGEQVGQPATQVHNQPQQQSDRADSGQSQSEHDPVVTVKVEDNGAQQTAEAQEAPVFQQVESTPIKVGEAPRAEQAPETAAVEHQVADKLTQAVQNGETTVEIQLDPANLGKVNVELTVTEDGVLHISLKAENSATRSLLERDVTSLQTLLGRDGQEVRVEVQAQESQPREELYDQEKQQEQQQQQQQRREERRDGQDFLQQLRLGLVPADGEDS